MMYDDIFDRRDEILFSVMENCELEEGVGIAAGAVAGSVIALLAGKAITKHYTKKQIREVINNGTITKETITKGIKECQNPKQFKQMKKMLENIVTMYPQQEKNPEMLKKRMPLINWINGPCLTNLVPKKERELINKQRG